MANTYIKILKSVFQLTNPISKQNYQLTASPVEWHKKLCNSMEQVSFPDDKHAFYQFHIDHSPASQQQSEKFQTLVGVKDVKIYSAGLSLSLY